MNCYVCDCVLSRLLRQASVLIDRVLDPRTIAPMQAFNKDQLLSIDRWNRALMFQHEDYTGKRAQYTDNSSKGFVDKYVCVVMFMYVRFYV